MAPLLRAVAVMATANVAGLGVGWLLAPIRGLVSWLRRSRMFHPRGLLFRAEVEPLA
jgi:hypothetical protein